jgi:predicted amidohydrolase
MTSAKTLSLRVANCQYTALADEGATLDLILPMIAEAASQGAEMICLPECATRMESNRHSLLAKSQTEADSQSLNILQQTAKTHGCWLLVGSLLLRADDQNDRMVNRCFLIKPDGNIRAHYDKIHMFDVEVNDGQTYRESHSFDHGHHAALVDMGGWKLGLTICYDLRFPHLYRQLAQAGADMITIPAAFTKVTGEAHWHPLMRARAIENGVFIVSPAQCGTHAGGRQTYGHALMIDPWGRVLSDAGETPAVTVETLDFSAISKARGAIPSLGNTAGDDISLKMF